MKFRILITAISLLFGNLAYSSVTITLNNQTKAACLLTNSIINTGELYTPPALSILSQQSASFIMSQKAYN